MNGLTPFASAAGKVYMSEDAIGTSDPAGGPVLVRKRDGSATVQAAYLLAAGVPDYTIAAGDITLNGTSLSFPAANSVVNDLSHTGGPINSVWTDVTSIVKPVVDAAPAGNVTFTAAEPNSGTTPDTDDIDGEILAVIMQDPTLPADNITSSATSPSTEPSSRRRPAATMTRPASSITPRTSPAAATASSSPWAVSATARRTRPTPALPPPPARLLRRDATMSCTTCCRSSATAIPRSR